MGKKNKTKKLGIPGEYRRNILKTLVEAGFGEMKSFEIIQENKKKIDIAFKDGIDYVKISLILWTDNK